MLDHRLTQQTAICCSMDVALQPRKVALANKRRFAAVFEVPQAHCRWALRFPGHSVVPIGLLEGCPKTATNRRSFGATVAMQQFAVFVCRATFMLPQSSVRLTRVLAALNHTAKSNLRCGITLHLPSQTWQPSMTQGATKSALRIEPGSPMVIICGMSAWGVFPYPTHCRETELPVEIATRRPPFGAGIQSRCFPFGKTQARLLGSCRVDCSMT